MKKLGEILVQKGAITQESLKYALDNQKKQNLRIGEFLVKNHIISEETLADALAEQLDIEKIDYEKMKEGNRKFLTFFRKSEMKEMGFFPYQVTDDKLYVAMKDPQREEVVQFVNGRINRNGKLQYVAGIASPFVLDRCIDAFTPQEDAVTATEAMVDVLGEIIDNRRRIEEIEKSLAEKEQPSAEHHACES